MCEDVLLNLNWYLKVYDLVTALILIFRTSAAVAICCLLPYCQKMHFCRSSISNLLIYLQFIPLLLAWTLAINCNFPFRLFAARPFAACAPFCSKMCKKGSQQPPNNFPQWMSENASRHQLHFVFICESVCTPSFISISREDIGSDNWPGCWRSRCHALWSRPYFLILSAISDCPVP